MLYEMVNEKTLRVKGEVALYVPGGFGRDDAGPAAFRASSEAGAVLAIGVVEGELGALPAEALALVPSIPQAPEGVGWGGAREGEVNGLPAAMARADLGGGAGGAVALYDCGGWTLVLAAWCPEGDAESARALMDVLESVRPVSSAPAGTEGGGPGGEVMSGVPVYGN